MNCTARSHSFRIWKEWLLSSAQPLPSHIHLHAQNMEWLQWVGSFKLEVSFAEYRLFYRVLLQKETYNWKEPCHRTTTALTHLSACHIHLHALNMERLQLVRSLKLEVSSAEYRLFHRVLLQKRPIILRSLLIVATPYRNCIALSIFKCAFEENDFLLVHTQCPRSIVCTHNAPQSFGSICMYMRC